MTSNSNLVYIINDKPLPCQLKSNPTNNILTITIYFDISLYAIFNLLFFFRKKIEVTSRLAF